MNTLNEIYMTLKSEGLCSTQTEFSEKWLGRSAHYMSQIGGEARKASLTSLQLLAAETKLVLQGISASDGMERYYRLRSAATAAATLFRGEYEVRNVPRRFWITAV